MLALRRRYIAQTKPIVTCFKSFKYSTTSLPVHKRVPPFESITKTLPCLIDSLYIPETFKDEMGHMNVRYYMSLFDDAEWVLLSKMGMTKKYINEKKTGIVSLKQSVNYLKEVNIGERISVYGRLIDLSKSKKRLRWMLFMVKCDSKQVAAICESENLFMNLETRQGCEIPNDLEENILNMIDNFSKLDWEPPISGQIEI